MRCGRSSAAEAAATASLLGRHGCEAEILRWSEAKPRSGLQEAARAARYRLLREACRRRGILHLLVAHHADDQAETVAMRAARQSGPDGLAGMSAAVELPEVRLLRPLLGVSRSRLTATLLARGVPWIDDPSNADPRFERARLRAGNRPAAPAADSGRPAPRAKARCRRGRGPGHLADRRCRHRPVGLCPFGAGPAGEAVEPGRPGDRRRGSPAATGPAGAGGRPSLRCRGARKVGQLP